MGVNTEYDESNLMNSKRRTSTVSDDPVIIEKIKDYCELTENSTQVHQKVYIFGWKNFGCFFSRIFLYKKCVGRNILPIWRKNLFKKKLHFPAVKVWNMNPLIMYGSPPRM